MKNYYLLFILIFLFSCNENSHKEKKISADIVQNPVSASDDGDFSKLPKVKFETEEHDFGTIVQGEKIAWVFNYENIGKSDFIISRVKSSCGCTIPKWSKKPLSPGGKEELEIIFDSDRKRGSIYKSITLFTNSQPSKIKLFIKGEVIIPN